MTGAQVSVVIPARNAAATLGLQLDALADQDVDTPWEVLVVDNGSTDGTVAVCERYLVRLPLRALHCDRPGTSAARNSGAAAAAGAKLLFCDADDRVGEGWVRAMAAALDTDDAVGGAIEDHLLNPGLQNVPQHPHGLPVVAGFLPRSITANFAVRRSVWEQLSGFAEDYDYGSDDTEFSWRLQLAGFTLGYAPDAVVHYRHRRTLRAVAVKAFRTGRSRGRLFRDYQAQGMPRPRITGAVLRWARIVVATPAALMNPRVRWWWADQAGAALGRVVGSVKYRVPYL